MVYIDTYKKTIEYLRNAKIIFWDFDGVIKDSIEIKSAAYERIFLQFGSDVAERVKNHHKKNGGLSRFDKIPLYLTWAMQPTTDANVIKFCELFSSLVCKAVIKSPWVKGVHEYLLTNYSKQNFILVTATPQDEICHILSATNIRHCFSCIYGAPVIKSHAIQSSLLKYNCAPSDALMVGDSESDLRAALFNKVPFLLRCTSSNLSLQTLYSGPKFEELSCE